MAKLGVSAIRINCQDLRPEVFGVEKMEIVTDYSEVVIETSNLIMKKAVFGDWEQLYRNITSRPESAKYMLWKIDDSEEESKDRMRNMLNTDIGCNNANGITLIHEITERPAKVPTLVPLAYGILCELKKTMKEAVPVKEVKDSPTVSIADKYSLSIQEAAEYYGIGEKRLRSIISEHYNEPFILEIGSHQRIKRRLFEEFLDQATAV